MENHKRYFIHRTNSDGSLEYRYQTGEWRDDFKDAQLWASKEFAIKKAKELKKSDLNWQKDSEFCGPYTGPKLTGMYVGEVTVTYNDQDWEEV